VSKTTTRKKSVAKKKSAAKKPASKKAVPKKKTAAKKAAEKKAVAKKPAGGAESAAERRVDRSGRTSVALDKILQFAVKRHKLQAAVLADTAGLLVASAKGLDDGERLAGVVSLVDTLREYLASYDVLDGLSEAVLRSPDGRGMALWPFRLEGDLEMILVAIFNQQPPPTAAIAEVIAGVARIVKTRAE